MNKIRVSGNLRRGDINYPQGHVYWLDVTRSSDTVDTLMVISQDDTLTEGEVLITGYMAAEYIKNVGIPVFIVPETIEEKGEDNISAAEVLGYLKVDPEWKTTKKKKVIASVLMMTDTGPIPVLMWGGTAKMASEKYKAGDMLRMTGRLQSRGYTDKKGNKRTTYEVSVKRIYDIREEEKGGSEK